MIRFREKWFRPRPATLTDHDLLQLGNGDDQLRLLQEQLQERARGQDVVMGEYTAKANTLLSAASIILAAFVAFGQFHLSLDKGSPWFVLIIVCLAILLAGLGACLYPVLQVATTARSDKPARLAELSQRDLPTLRREIVGGLLRQVAINDQVIVYLGDWLQRSWRVFALLVTWAFVVVSISIWR